MNTNPVDLKMIPMSKGRQESGTSGEAPGWCDGGVGKGEVRPVCRQQEERGKPVRHVWKSRPVGLYGSEIQTEQMLTAQAKTPVRDGATEVTGARAWEGSYRKVSVVQIQPSCI